VHIECGSIGLVVANITNSRIIQFDTNCQKKKSNSILYSSTCGPVKNLCALPDRWLVATVQFGRPQSFFVGDAHGHIDELAVNGDVGSKAAVPHRGTWPCYEKVFEF